MRPSDAGTTTADWASDVCCADDGAQLRDEVGTLAGRAGVPHDRLADVALAASELLSNACEHGSHVRVEMVASSGVMEVRVSNAAPQHAVPPPSQWTMPSDPLAPRGRGLAIVKRVSDRVGARWQRGRLTVVAGFLTPGSGSMSDRARS